MDCVTQERCRWNVAGVVVCVSGVERVTGQSELAFRVCSALKSRSNSRERVCLNVLVCAERWMRQELKCRNLAQSDVIYVIFDLPSNLM